MLDSMEMRQRKIRTGVIASLLVGALSTLGCKNEGATNEDEDSSFAADGADANSAETDAELLTSTLISSSPGTIGLASVELTGTDLETSDLGDGARAAYVPRGCVSTTNDTANETVTYRFNRCIGPNGLRAVTGEVKARYHASTDRLHLEMTATGLSVNEATLDWAATADISSSGADRTMVWKAQLSGTTAGGRPFARTSEHTVSWTLGEACFSLEGSSEGEIRSRSIRTEISNFHRCRRGCPDAGGTIVITNVTKNKRVALRYDGSNRATFVNANGKQTTIELLCRP